MAAYRGKSVVVTFNSVDISGDGRSISYEESADILDDTVYGADNKTKQAGLLDGNGTYTALDTTGAWGAAWEAMQPGASATLSIQPEGAGVGLRDVSFTAVIKSRSIDFPYEDLSKLSMSFEISGAVVETEQSA
jgi:hypothetical protein